MFREISGKEHSRLNAMLFNISNDILAIHTFPTGQEESEPAWSGIFTGGGQNEPILHPFQTCQHTVKIISAAFHKGREFLELRDSRLHIRRL